MVTEAQRRATKKYKAKVKRISLDFHPTEMDLYDHVSEQPMKQTYIKALIAADMNSQKVK